MTTKQDCRMAAMNNGREDCGMKKCMVGDLALLLWSADGEGVGECVEIVGEPERGKTSMPNGCQCNQTLATPKNAWVVRFVSDNGYGVFLETHLMPLRTDKDVAIHDGMVALAGIINSITKADPDSPTMTVQVKSAELKKAVEVGNE